MGFTPIRFSFHTFRAQSVQGRAMDPTAGVWFQAGTRIFFIAFIPALGPIQPPIQWVPGALSSGVKREGREANHSSLSSGKVRMEELYLHCPMLFHSLLHDGLSTGTTLPYILHTHTSARARTYTHTHTHTHTLESWVRLRRLLVESLLGPWFRVNPVACFAHMGPSSGIYDSRKLLRFTIVLYSPWGLYAREVYFLINL
jgi:hypothetical protein